MINWIKNKIIQAIVNSVAFENKVTNICDQYYIDIDNLNNEIENSIKSNGIVTRDDLAVMIEDRLAVEESEVQDA